MLLICRCLNKNIAVCVLNDARRTQGDMSLQESVSGIMWKKHMGRDVSNVDVICNCCRGRIYRKIKVNDSERKKASHIEKPFVKPCSETKQTLKSPKSFSLETASTPRSHKYCVVCKQDGSRRNSLSSIPQTALTQAFIQTGVFVFPQSRCCRGHVESEYISTTRH